MFNPSISPGTVMTNKQISALFACGIEGGMRKSKKNHCLVLIANHVKDLYDDKWHNDILYFAGMGKKGDQSLDYRQNKTLYNSKNDGTLLFLFEVFKEGEYTYYGQVCLIDEPFEEHQKGEDGNERKVWIFKLKKCG